MAFLDQASPVAFAHRGFALDGVENSLLAFERAVGLGFRYLETDVRVTADGVALAFHDRSLDRVTDRSGRIATLPWAEVRNARIAGREPIPLLADVLGAWPDVRVNLDVKSRSGLRPVADVIRRTGALERVCVAAFSDPRIRAVRALLGPRLCTALGPAEVGALMLSARTGRRARPRGRCAQVPAQIGSRKLVDARFVEAAHRAGVQVHVWTVNDPAQMRSLLDLGVDGLMSDRADLLRDVLRERGAWSADAAG